MDKYANSTSYPCQPESAVDPQEVILKCVSLCGCGIVIVVSIAKFWTELGIVYGGMAEGPKKLLA